MYGYKAHVRLDADSRVVTNVQVPPANVNEAQRLVRLLPRGRGAPPRVLTADKAYDVNALHDHLAVRGIRNGIIPRGRRVRPSRAVRRSLVARRHRWRIEPLFGECALWHSLKQARYVRLARVRVQMLLTFLVANVKRLVRSFYTGPPWARIALRTVAAG